MKKITINMLSSADKVAGQGVGSAYLELIKLLREDAKDIFEIHINKGTKFDILHAHTVDLINYFKLKFTKGKKVAYVHFLPTTLDGSIKIPKLFFKIFKWYVIKFYKQADKLVVVNPSFIPEMIENGLDEKKIVYIPNFVSREQFHELDSKEKISIRKEYGYDKDDFIVMGAGQVQTRKGVMDFVEVAKKLPDVKFVWAGGFSFGSITDGHEELKKIMDNPPKNVNFLGIVDRSKMNDLFNMSNVYFAPSYNELFPMTILESTNCHIPLLLRNLDLYKDILFKKYTRGNDNDDFIEEIIKLKDDKNYYIIDTKDKKEINRKNRNYFLISLSTTVVLLITIHILNKKM